MEDYIVEKHGRKFIFKNKDIYMKQVAKIIVKLIKKWYN